MQPLTDLPRRKVYPPAWKKAVDAILKQPEASPRRWRASVAFYLNTHPAAKWDYELCAQEAKDLSVQQANPFASGRKGDIGMRFGLHAPHWFMTVIEAFDHNSFDRSNPKARDNLRKLIRAFPEFKIMEKV